MTSGDYWGTRNLQTTAEFDAAKKKKCKHQQIRLFVSLLIHICKHGFLLILTLAVNCIHVSPVSNYCTNTFLCRSFLLFAKVQ